MENKFNLHYRHSTNQKGTFLGAFFRCKETGSAPYRKKGHTLVRAARAKFKEQNDV